MTTIILYIGVAIGVICGLAFLFFKKVPHGWVQFRTGLVLKFMPPLDHKPVLQVREGLEKFVNSRLPSIKKSLPVDNTRDIDIPTRHGAIKARVYEGSGHKAEKLLVLMHGGGWCIGSMNTYEEVSRRLVRATGLSLVSLEYSLAPEAKFPQAHEECLDAATWLSEHMTTVHRDAKSLVLVGDSAGGNLVVSTAYECSAEVRATISDIVAVYPVVDSRKSDYYSSDAFANGYYLTKKAMSQFTEAMVTSASQVNDDRLSPLYHEAMKDYPRIFVLTAEFDPLRDQGETFAKKLHKEGNDVQHKRYTGAIHAFFGLKDFGSKGLEAISDIGLFLKHKPISAATTLSES